MQKVEQKFSNGVKEYFQEFSERKLQLIKNPVFLDLDFHEEDSQLVSSLENQTEYLGRRLSTNTSVPGNIHRPRYREFWEKELEAPQFVLGHPFCRLLPPLLRASPSQFRKKQQKC